MLDSRLDSHHTMPLQLVVQDEGKTLRYPLAEGELVLGSGADADVRLAHPTVSRRHALLRVTGDGVELEDLGSRNGTRIDGRRIAERESIAPEQPVSFGSLEARIESVEEEDLVPAVTFGDPESTPEPGVFVANATTASVGSLRVFGLDRLPRLVRLLEDDAGPSAVAQAVGAALFETLPCASVEVTRPAARGEEGLLFRAAHEGMPAEGVEARGERGPYLIRAVFLHDVQARGYVSLIDTMARWIALSDRRFRPEPISRERLADVEPPRPPSVVDEVKAIYRDAARIGRGEVGVLITGESGTGKEVLARYLHACSPRRERAFVALNCAALPKDLLESELLGVEQGVATGVTARAGKFELAHGGTLFLDEIGDMAPETQAKILRVLQEGEVYRLGGQEPRPAKVRVIAATNKDLDAMIEDGSFRRDLYHRIADWRVTIPPLRRRRADIPNLAAWFLQQEAERQGVRVAGISRAAVEALTGYAWPGNIRQLEREMARAVLFLEDGRLLQSSHLQSEIREAEDDGPADDTLAAKVEALERREIRAAVQRNDGNLSAAARDLGIARSTLYRRMDELGLGSGEGE